MSESYINKIINKEGRGKHKKSNKKSSFFIFFQLIAKQIIIAIIKAIKE